jgi:hypothetical protein
MLWAMRSILLGSLFILAALCSPTAHASRSAAAQQDENSLWRAQNRSSAAVDLWCDGYGHSPIFAVNGLLPQALYTHQFDRGWADGSGYFEPHVPIHCRITDAVQPASTFDFETLDYGDTVWIFIDATTVTVTVQKDRAWGTEQRRTTHTPR